MIVPVAASILLVIGAPFIGQIRGAIQSAIPGQFRSVVVGAIAMAIILALAIAIARIREHRLSRYLALAVALSVGVAYAMATRTGNSDVDAVERFHFIEYGLLATLFFNGWRHRGDLTVWLYPILACLIVATADEGLQWFVPERVGEAHDVLLDGVAIGCGLIFATAVAPAAHLTLRLASSARLSTAVFAALTIMTLALFFHIVHLGYEVRAADGAAFRSRFTSASLHAAAWVREGVWRVNPPVVLRRLSREDQYLSEGLWHVQRRNQAAGDSDMFTAWHENRILEEFFAPVLDFPSYRAPGASRWPAEQRANTAAQLAGDSRPFVSDAHPFPIRTWSKTWFWILTASGIALVAWLCHIMPADRRAPSAASI